MKRVGPRGSGEFERISWDEALDLAAENIQRVKETYGNSALYVPYGTGSYNQSNGQFIANRLFNVYGGSLGYYNNYSWAAIQRATPTVYGTQLTGNQRQDWINSKYFIMWGWNPAEMIDGTNSAYFVKKARENGAKVVVIDPRKTRTAVSLADEWIAIRPGTDMAMMSAMAYVMITEELYDAEFVETHCLGFDSSQMPEGLEDEESYKDYILGTVDGIPRHRNGPKRLRGYLARKSSRSRANTPPSSPACSTRVTVCSAAHMASRWFVVAVCWQRLRAMSVSPVVGPVVSPSSLRTGVHCGQLFPWDRIRFRPVSPAFYGRKP
jgi:anaerobic selenocysteine-containing dehydrogenase